MMLSLIGILVSLYVMMGLIAVTVIALILLPYFIEQWIVDLKKLVERSKMKKEMAKKRQAK